ncbi:MAG TPA: hypothetical protein VHC46_04950 [Thermodesulfobacteriota bacterium]|nr:hypothetical protein [Thermodesulfobacteriota bacterium]
MALNAKELTDLSKETTKASLNLDKILDFVDVINKNAEEIEGDTGKATGAISELANKIAPYIIEIKDLIEDQLNKIEIDPEETKDAAEKLLLYHGNIHQVISWADVQKSAHKKDSYWWRYWVDVLENVMQLEVAKQAGGKE